MTMRVLFFVQHFYPSREIGARRPSELAKYLLSQGHKVDALCATVDGPWDEAQRRDLASCDITQVSVPPKVLPRFLKAAKRVKANLLGGGGGSAAPGGGTAAAGGAGGAGKPKTIGSLKRWYFSLESLYSGLKLWSVKCVGPAWRKLGKGQYDVVITSCPPMNTALVVRMLRALGRGRFRWVIDLRDPFLGGPPLPSNTSWLRRKLERWAERSCLGNCDAIIVSTPGLAADVKSRDPAVAGKVHVIYNGYDGEPNFLAPPATDRTVRMLSAGTIYYRRDPRPLLDALQIVLGRGLPKDAFHVTFLGTCESPSRETLLQWIADRGLSHAVEIHPVVPPREVEGFMQKAHVLVNFAQEQGIMVPAKTYEYIASGREVLTITEPDSDTAAIVARAGCGPTTLPDATKMADILADFYDRYILNARRWTPDLEVARGFSRTGQNREMSRIVTSLV